MLSFAILLLGFLKEFNISIEIESIFIFSQLICSVNLLNKRVKIPARDSLYGLLCKKILLDVVAHFLCFPNLQVKVDHADNQIFH